jgi:ribonucleotide reductase beta subunit family protein with ferritin-like domain
MVIILALENQVRMYRIYKVYTPEDEVDEHYKKQQASMMWEADEIKYELDKPDFKRLTQDRRHLIEMILGFFAPADGLVMQNIALRFMAESKTVIELGFFSFQNSIETVHSDVYSRFIQTFVPDEKRQQEIFRMADENPAVGAKIGWMEKYMMSKEATKGERFFAFACVEGIFFSVLFAIIFWFRTTTTPFINFVHANELIARDEALHCEYGCTRFKRSLRDGEVPSIPRIYEILKEAVEIEEMFVRHLLPKPILELSVESLTSYTHVVADSILSMCGLEPLYRDKNPFPFMHSIGGRQKPNIHERNDTNYSRKVSSTFKKPANVDEVDF